ncbi:MULTISPECIES: lycopene cyclase domain-containing protein [Halolamina]|uniref:Lycopene cyclase domain-containing protein n=1 Tax=Halolamina pelagica TaxID=699431 RepID=A0A1I5SEC9_9EURY|nr:MULTISPECIES: lycopene cyclase domain-containing protein [Halolamina]NHX37113.1 lycopene cyclase domain-containing protein [Halolamina sp. R1-12]SFP68686.1 lycopene cyclase domain-containing protein [Halolamina pelagica]
MAIARHGSGPAALASAYASQVHPVFMLPPVATAVFGAALAGPFAPRTALIAAGAAFFAVYTAHVKDGYVDFHRRGEDDDHPLTVFGCRLGLAAATVGFLACLGGLAVLGNLLAAAVAAPMWAIGYFHAPQFDTNPATTTLGYPVGVGLCLLTGYAAQTGVLATRPLALAAVLVTVLGGVKVVDDAQDYAYDRSIEKRTVAVALGQRRARALATAALGVGLFAVVPLSIVGVLPPSAPAASLVYGAVAAVALGRDPETATMLLVRGAYLFLAVLLVAVFFEPLAGASPPDITVLGSYTYLATEVVFGAAALALLRRAGDGALRRAARTIPVLYPVAYVWDWYTLEVGVFAIPMRTGIELLGIPLEEHVFMLVVPALVLGIHETVNPRAA